MAVITGLAYERQFLDHLAPVWAALPKAIRGEFLVEPGLEEYAASIGVDARPVARLMVDRGRPIPPNLQASAPALVASYGDTKEARRFGYGPIAFIEHGAGQAYDTPHANISGSYAGGPDRADTSLFMVPNEYSAALWRRAYPGARVEIVGCPKLDTLPRRAPLKPHPVAAVSFHWDGPNVPYGGTAMHEYIPILGELARRFNVIGHAHPKGHHPEVMARVYQRAGIEFVPDFSDVCRRADLYVCDNSCVTPDTLVLCSDLRWRSAGVIKPGDVLIGCDEEATRKGRLRDGREVDREDRRFRSTAVVANERRMLPCRTVTTDRGTLTVSERHPYLVRRSVPYNYVWPEKGWTFKRSHEQWQWVEARHLQTGDQVAYVGEPWLDATDRDSGWLAGMFDGEGNLNITASKHEGSQHRRLALSVAQNRGPVLDELVRVLEERDLPYVTQGVRGSAKGRNCRKITIGGRLFARLRLLGEIRPLRLLAKAIASEAWAGANVSANVQRATVLSVEDTGEREVCVMQTTERTFIAGGFMAHNSTIFEFAATDRPVVLMNARHWSRKGGPGGRFWDWAHVGINVDVPNALPDAVARALLDDPDEQRAREHALSLVYAYRFGGAERAAAAVVDWMGSMAAAA